MTASKYAPFARVVLYLNLAVIAWGAFVRASFSGDGCGPNWPLCDGQIIPTNASVARLIEFSHRASSGIVGLLVVLLCVLVARACKKGSHLRKLAFAAAFFTASEAMLGAALVHWKWVAHDDSVYRAGAMCSHLANTFFLLASLSALVWYLDRGSDEEFRAPRLRGQGTLLFLLGLGGLALIALGASGALSALGHQLKPVDNVLVAAMSPTANYLNRLQPLHPLIATSVGLYIVLMGGLLIHLRPGPRVKYAVQVLVGLYATQFLLGVLNIFLKAPIPMQLGHLLAADVTWICLVYVALAALSERFEEAVGREGPAENLALANRPHGVKLVREYVALTKPRVISLLLFTTYAALFAAKGGWPGWTLLLGVTVGGYFAAGAANAINMVIDRDIDEAMERTRLRPTVTQHISSRNALLFAFALAMISFVVLTATANLLSAMLAFAGLVFYVIVYTMGLKRRTWQNIVIGGAAGAIPPLVGWAAATNTLSLLALYLFAIVFLWTPVHFWALALLIKDDYREAGIPMLPVVRGERATAIQIGMYGVLTAIVSVLPLAQRQVGWVYMGSAIALNVVLLARCLGLYRRTDRPRAVSLFKYSMLYLALLFLMVAVDRAVLS